jgi:hypothetical protein
MSQPTIIVRGTILPDGTLELAERLSLPAGEVEVTVRPVRTEKESQNGVESPSRTRAEFEAAEDSFHTADTLTIIQSHPNGEQNETLLELMLRTRAELEASGAVFRTKEEIDADLEADRDWDSRLDEIRRQAEESQRQVEPR